MKSIAVLVVAAACACSYPTPAARDDAARAAENSRGKTASADLAPPAARARPTGTFDLLSEVAPPGGLVTQVVTLPAGWKVTGTPRLTEGAAAFSIETTRTDGDRYVVVARNTGKEPARLVADVPCSGCP